MSSRPNSALLTDLYQLTMMHGYFEQGMEDLAVFEFFVRKLPERRNFLVAAGLEQVVSFLERLRFQTDELDWLRSTGRFPRGFLDYLAGIRFTGDVDAMPEGSVFFPNEPILRLSAPLPEAQLVETRIINLLHFQTLIASKAARMSLAAPGKLLVDFGLRRAHGAEAGLLAARASYLAGLAGTATALAGLQYGIPVYGTMAHAFIQAHDDEAVAFEHFALAQRDDVVLLIDTYDTEAAAEKVVKLAPKLRAKGIVVKGVRIDSGDLADHARKVRAILDAGGLKDVHIFASGNLDEYMLARYAQAGVPIDGFGMGTRLATSCDAPYLDCAYKLQEYAGRPRRKRSEGKATMPGRKQVYRYYHADGRMRMDSMTLVTDVQRGRALLQPVMHAGTLIEPLPALDQCRHHTLEEVAALPEDLKGLEPAGPYPVSISAELEALALTVEEPPATLLEVP